MVLQVAGDWGPEFNDLLIVLLLVQLIVVEGESSLPKEAGTLDHW